MVVGVIMHVFFTVMVAYFSSSIDHCPNLVPESLAAKRHFGLSLKGPVTNLMSTFRSFYRSGKRPIWLCCSSRHPPRLLKAG
ncbi:hypothetical protein SAMN05428981_1011268 [Bacillus sp. OV194]|nr:hypothetical protein SAMN05428981_1011268 [Bacillus sp. OV194]